MKYDIKQILKFNILLWWLLNIFRTLLLYKLYFICYLEMENYILDKTVSSPELYSICGIKIYYQLTVNSIVLTSVYTIKSNVFKWHLYKN